MWEYFVEIETGHFRDYLSLIKKSIATGIKAIEKKDRELKEKGAKEIFHEDYGYYNPFDELADELHTLERTEQLMLRAFIVSVFIFWENQINRVSRIVGEKEKTPFKINDLTGNGVSRSIKYLEKISGKEIFSNVKDKDYFEVAKRIRNAVVHSDCVVNENDMDRIEKYISKNDFELNLSQLHVVIISVSYAESMIDFTMKLSDELRGFLPKNHTWF